MDAQSTIADSASLIALVQSLARAVLEETSTWVRSRPRCWPRTGSWPPATASGRG